MYFIVDFEPVIRGHHVYKSVWTPVVHEMLECNKNERAEAKEHEDNAIDVYRVRKQLDDKKTLAGHVPIELSRLLKNFLEINSENKLFAQSHWKEEERSWACCAGKVLGLHNGTAHCKNSENRAKWDSNEI